MALPPKNRELPELLLDQEESCRVEQELDHLISTEAPTVFSRVNATRNFHQVYKRICSLYEPLGWRVTGTNCEIITLEPR